jgi:hypothetical protein
MKGPGTKVTLSLAVQARQQDFEKKAKKNKNKNKINNRVPKKKLNEKPY